MNTLNGLSGSQVRAAKRSGEIGSMTRAEVSREIQTIENVDELARYLVHPSRRVKRSAFARALWLGTEAERDYRNQFALTEASVEQTAEIQALAIPVEKSELETLIERFTAEGKKDPLKSARASLARKAQIAKKNAA